MPKGKTKGELVHSLLGDTRIRVVSALLSGPKNISGLAQSLGTDRSTVCHHLSMLETAGLLKSEYRILEASGPKTMAARFYSIDEDRMREAVEAVEELIQPIREALKEREF